MVMTAGLKVRVAPPTPTLVVAAKVACIVNATKASAVQEAIFRKDDLFFMVDLGDFKNPVRQAGDEVDRT